VFVKVTRKVSFTITTTFLTLQKSYYERLKLVITCLSDCRCWYIYCPTRRFFGKPGGDPPLVALVSLSFKGEPKYTGADTPCLEPSLRFKELIGFFREVLNKSENEVLQCTHTLSCQIFSSESSFRIYTSKTRDCSRLYDKILRS